MTLQLRDRFRSLLERHVHRLTVHGTRASGVCPCHQEKTPSFSIDMEKGVFHCFGCGLSGEVKKFAELVGEAWTITHSESRAAKAQRLRFRAEQQAQTILQQRAEQRDLALCAEHRELHTEALAAADLLTLFHRRPDLAEEFADLVATTERQYGDALFRLSILAAKLDGELEA